MTAEDGADAKVDTPVLRGLGVPFPHPLLERNSAAHGIHHTDELGEQPIPRRLDHPPPVLGDAGLDQFGAVGGECGERAFLVLSHQPRVARHVGGKDGGKTALDAFFGHKLGPLSENSVREIVWATDRRVHRVPESVVGPGCVKTRMPRPSAQ
jgi:hypothetical protein